MRVLALDIGGTKIAAAMVDRWGRVSHRHQCATLAHQGGLAVLERVINLAQEVLAGWQAAGHELPVAVGIGTGGQVDPVSGSILSATDVLPAWAGTPLKSAMQSALNLPVAVDNDVNATGIGEATHGAGRGARNLLVVAVGTGIGGAVIIDGQVVHGHSGLAGHVGHVSIDALHGKRCNCGSVGCVEMYASGPAIAATWQGQVDPELSAAWLAKPIDAVRVPDIAELAYSGGMGSKAARAVLHQSGRYLGYAIASLLHVLNPERVVVGGGVAQVGEALFAGVREAVHERGMIPVKKTLIVPAALGADAALVGAAELAFRGVSP